MKITVKLVGALQTDRFKIEELTVATVLDYVHAHPARDFSILTIGPAALT